MRRRNRKLLNKSKDPSKIKEDLYYRGIPCDSNEEVHFLMWAYELKEAGYIENIKRGESYLLCGPMTNDYAKQLKTKSKPYSETLLQGHSYTPDFEIIWSQLGAKEFVWIKEFGVKLNKLFIGKIHNNSFGRDNDEVVTHIEVKPGFDFNNMTRAFKINQKWMWNKFSIFVNLTKPQELFEKTFTPSEFLITPTGKPRKIDWQVKSINEFLAI